MDQFDVIIIGAGPTGLAVGIECKKAGMSSLILEKGVLVNSLFHFPTNMTFFSTSNLLEIGEVPFISHSDKPTRREALEYYRRVWHSWDLDIHLYEEVNNIHKNTQNQFEVATSKGLYYASAIVVATGFFDLPVKMGIPGEDLPKVKHYYDEAHHYIGQKVVVVGAANSACDVALETWQKGAEVIMVIRSKEIYPRVKYWIKPNIENRIKEGSIKAYFSSELVHIRENSVDIRTPDGLITLENDFVLAMTGYQPDYSFLRRIGIQILDDEYATPQFDPDSFETNIQGMYLAGVVCGGLKTNRYFIENSRIHAPKLVDDIAKKYKLQQSDIV